MLSANIIPESESSTHNKHNCDNDYHGNHMVILLQCSFLILPTFKYTSTCKIAHHGPNSYNNCCSPDYYDNSLSFSHFLSCLLKRNLLLRPFRKYLFSLKCLCAQEEKNYVCDKGSAGDNPDSTNIQLYCADFGGNVNKEEWNYYQNPLQLGGAGVGGPRRNNDAPLNGKDGHKRH